LSDYNIQATGQHVEDTETQDPYPAFQKFSLLKGNPHTNEQAVPYREQQVLWWRIQREAWED
jgi:hypothetical protein